MRNLYRLGLLGVVGLALYLVYWGINLFQPQFPLSNLILASGQPSGFQRAEGPRVWDFPTDMGPHPSYQTEWWYYTGNLESEQGAHFGYQLTFFRRALLPEGDRVARQSAWGAEQVYMAHFALSDIEAGEHYAFERFSRGAAGLAGAQAAPYQVWLENWQVSQLSDGTYRLSVRQGEIVVDLQLEDLKGPILHGDRGYSQKGPEIGNASYYYSQTRLRSSGRVQTPAGSYQVKGLSWKDHEFSTSALSEGQVGWDWFSLQLDDGSELMVFQIRREDGSLDPHSSGTWISANEEVSPLVDEEFDIQVEDKWRSPNSGADYPSKWRLEIPGLAIILEVEPYLPDQEMNVSYVYWEGAVKVSGTVRGERISGSGYVELTGYAGSIAGEF